MSHDRNASLVLDAGHQLVAATGHDEVDVLVLREEGRDLRASRDSLHERRRDRRLGERLGDDLRQKRRRLDTLLAALQNGRVTRLDRERGNVHNDLRTRLEDDKQHAHRAGDAVQRQPWAELLRERNLPSGEGKRRNVADTLQHRIVLASAREVEAAEQRSGELARLDEGAGGFHVGLVCGEDGVAVLGERGADRAERNVALGRGDELGGLEGAARGHGDGLGGVGAHFVAEK